MPSKYFTILTNIGSALHANAQIQQTKVPWTHMALGDGGGVEVQPDQKQTALVREVHRLPITAIDPHPTNPNWIVVEAVVPNNVGGWTVRETAIYGGTGVAQCIAVGNYPASYKPVLAEGAVREMVMRMIVEISSTATVNLVIDPAVAIASRQFVEEFVGKELQKLDNKQSVRVATTANIVLSGLQSIDAIALVASDRVLVKDQASGKDNGIYTAAAGTWSRAVDADTSAKVTPQLSVGVEQGTINGDSVWMLTTDAPIVLGTTALVFEVGGGKPMATKDWSKNLLSTEFQKVGVGLYRDGRPDFSTAKPKDLYSTGTRFSFSSGGVLGITGLDGGGYGTLVLHGQFPDWSGVPAFHRIFHASGRTFVSFATDENTWSAWEEQATQSYVKKQIQDSSAYSVRDIAAQRALGITYTNTTKNLMFVYVYGRSVVGAATASIHVGAELIIGSSYPVEGLSIAVGVMVPPGFTYKVPAGQMELISWVEMSV